MECCTGKYFEVCFPENKITTSKNLLIFMVKIFSSWPISAYQCDINCVNEFLKFNICLSWSTMSQFHNSTRNRWVPVFPLTSCFVFEVSILFRFPFFFVDSSFPCSLSFTSWIPTWLNYGDLNSNLVCRSNSLLETSPLAPRSA